jgi:hypothetical protein
MLPLELNKFAILDRWHEKLDQLEQLALPEPWGFKTPNPTAKNKKNPILSNYIKHTYKKLASDYNAASAAQKANFIAILDNAACFNTGLYTEHYNEIFMFFRPAKYSTTPWLFIGFFEPYAGEMSEFQSLPKRANFFSDMTELLFDCSLDLRVNASHILNDPNNRERIPEEYRDHPSLTTFFNGAIDLAKKKVSSNYKIAVPQYYEGSIQLLLPICLSNPQTTDLALVVSRNGNFYSGRTCLTLDWAYNNARLIAKPNSDWLIP